MNASSKIVKSAFKAGSYNLQRTSKNWNPTAYWDKPKFLLGDAAAASGLSPNTLKAWLARGIVELGGYDHEASGKGSSRLFTLRSMLSIALAADLVRLGLSPTRAVLPAFAATRSETPPDVESLLLVFPSVDKTSWKVVNIGEKTPIGDHLKTGLETSVAAVSIRGVFGKVIRILVERGKLK
jgi:hypothetical protein